MRGNRRGRLILVLLLLTALTLITLNYRSGSSSSLRKIGSSVFGPIENAFSDVVRPIGSFFSGLGHLSSYKADNDRLRAENAKLRNELAAGSADTQELQALEKSMGLANRAGFKVVAGDVTVVQEALGLQWTASIDRGSATGVRIGQPVINGDGLVGKIVQVSHYTSTMELACDPHFFVSTFLESNNQRGSLQGQGLTTMKLTMLAPQLRVDPGERLVTAGVPPFEAQIPVGTVRAVETGTTATGQTVALVKPFVDFTSLTSVEIVTAATLQLARGALLQPRVPPTPPGGSSSATPNGSTSTPGSTTTTPAGTTGGTSGATTGGTTTPPPSTPPPTTTSP